MTAFHDRGALETAYRQGLRPKYLFFWGHRSRGGLVDKSCLSQWFPSPFEVDGEVYPTAEHWMMAGKAKLFGDEATRVRILAARSPGAAKKLGRLVRTFDAAMWDARSLDIVAQGNVHKFIQNQHLGTFLIGTGKRVLVEASPQDRIWGIGLAQSNPHATNPLKWRGENKLGFALMMARARLPHG